jgi:TrmH family RNA methyltransferase
VIGARHPVLSRLRQLSRQRKARDAEGTFVIDGPKLVAEALAAGVALLEVVAEPDAPAELVERARGSGATVHRAPAGTLARVTATATPQPIAAIAVREDRALGPVLDGLDRPELVVVLVGVNDPGNAGTLLRSADAVGAGAVVFSDDAVDPYNPKCVRASAGSLFRVPVVRWDDAATLVAVLRERGLRSVGTVARGGRAYDEVDLTRPTAVVLGSEAHGLPDDVGAQLDERATIPMRAPVESLNVAMAGTLLCFEALRQRRGSQDRSRNRLDDASSPGAGCSAA